MSLFAPMEPLPPVRELRDYQSTAIDALRQALREGAKRPLLQAPTGAGKTRIAGAIIDMARAKNNRVAFCVPALSLIDQTVESFTRDGIEDIGVIQANHIMTNWRAPVQVCSIDTLTRRGFPDVKMVIVDEAHRKSETIVRWMAEKPEMIFIGLSATPWAKGLGKHYDRLIIVTTIAELIERQYLSPMRVFAPAHPDLSGVKTTAGDYNEGQLADAMNKAPLVADVVETWIKRGEARPTLCFAVDRAHAKHLQQRFEGAGVRCGYQDAYTDPPERAQIREDFKCGRLEVVCNVGTLTTGVDWDVRCIILARPTKSEMLHVQIIGRGLRTADGKADCIAEGQRVLTDHGPVPIESVTKAMRVWDGESWVQHGGAICKGEQSTICYSGVSATPDHMMWTQYGWKSLRECADRRLRIAQTGRDGQAIRLSSDYFAPSQMEHIPVRIQNHAGASAVRHLWSSVLDYIRQHSAGQVVRLPGLQPAFAGSEVAQNETGVGKGPMRESEKPALSRLGWSRDRVPLSISNRCGDLGEEQSWPRSHQACGSDRQRWSLRAWQSSALDALAKPFAHTKNSFESASACFSAKISRSALRGFHAFALYVRRHVGSGNHRKMEYPVAQTKRQVWDILNAGPFHRFTVEGRLVHNCLILDHSDNHQRLGFVTDIHHPELDDGKDRGKAEKRKPPVPKECPSCHYLRPPKVSKCPACGFQPAAQSNVEIVDGELQEITRGKKTEINKGGIVLRGVLHPHRLFYRMLMSHAASRGYKPGFAAAKYKDAIGTWPPRAWGADAPADASYEVSQWLRSQQIKYAKRRPN